MLILSAYIFLQSLIAINGTLMIYEIKLIATHWKRLMVIVKFIDPSESRV